MPADNLFRFTYLVEPDTHARCDGCKWRASSGKPATIAANARKHVRETGHNTRVFDTRVTFYSRHGTDD